MPLESMWAAATVNENTRPLPVGSATSGTAQKISATTPSQQLQPFNVNNAISVGQEAAKAKQPKRLGLAASKYASISTAKVPQEVGLYMTRDPNLKVQHERVAQRQPGSSQQPARQPHAQPAQGGALLSIAPQQQPNVTYKGRGFKDKAKREVHQNLLTSFSPPTGPLRGEALIAEQNRRALHRHSDAARRANQEQRSSHNHPNRLEHSTGTITADEWSDTGKGRRDAAVHGQGLAEAPQAFQMPSNISSAHRFDKLHGPPPIMPEHLKLNQTAPDSSEGRLKTMADFMACNTMTKVANREDQRHTVYFDKWATPERRRGPTTQIRRVILTNLPSQCSTRDIARLVWGGDIEEIRYKDGETRASVLFVNARKCAKYHEDTSSGIEWKNRTIWVELHNQVEPLVGIRHQMIENGHTRCVRASNVDDTVLPGVLHRLGKDTAALEHMTVAHPASKRKDVIWRFCNLDAASSFRLDLLKDSRFLRPGCQVCFAEDPCAKAEGVHD